MKKIKKYIILIISLIIILILGLFLIFSLKTSETNFDTKKLNASVLLTNQHQTILQDKNNIIYTINNDNLDVNVGEIISLNYTGLLNKNSELQNIEIKDYETNLVMKENNNFPKEWYDNGIFKDYYDFAYKKVQNMTLDEKIAQILLVRYPNNNQINVLKKYQFGGFVFFEKDFKDKTKKEVKEMINSLQNNSKIPLLTAVDEEGGKVVRISSNPNLSKKIFQSSSYLYNLGGLNLIAEDTIEKSFLLNELGLNVNLAPVIDVATNPDAYIYDRTLKQNTDITSEYAKTVIEASKGTGVSYTLKHFPGYANNSDTHTNISTDNRSYENILENDLPPFKAGINAGAEAVLISHNIVTSIDDTNPASLSISVHNLLRNELGFTGIIITDDLAMSAVSNTDNIAVKAILAGNDLLITTDYENDIAKIKEAIYDGTLSENIIDKLATRVISWKYYKGLLFENQK